MKNVILAMLPLILCSCGEGWNSTKCRARLIEAMPGAEVQLVPGMKFTFIARDKDGSVWWIEYSGTKAEPTEKLRLFPSSK